MSICLILMIQWKQREIPRNCWWKHLNPRGILSDDALKGLLKLSSSQHADTEKRSHPATKTKSRGLPTDKWVAHSSSLFHDGAIVTFAAIHESGWNCWVRFKLVFKLVNRESVVLLQHFVKGLSVYNLPLTLLIIHHICCYHLSLLTCLCPFVSHLCVFSGPRERGRALPL